MKGTSIDVISLRLFPCPVRFDLWSPRCWAVYRENREKRRGEMLTISRYIQTLNSERPLIVGGDFNAPPGDAVFRLLAPLVDAFRDAGRGWGGTIINEVPALRIDQIWCTVELTALAAFAQRTEHSDHRMVIADLQGPDAVQ
jgi:vancomycin resistance protein VanJ